MSDIRGRFRPDGTTEHALAVQTTCRPIIIIARDDCVVRRPPVPAEFVEALSNRLPKNPDRYNGRWTWRPFRIRRISVQPRDTPVEVALFVVGFQLFVIDGPVIRHAVSGPSSEIGWMKARKMARPVMSASADGIKHQDIGWIGPGFHHRIVFPAPANVGAKVKCSPAE